MRPRAVAPKRGVFHSGRKPAGSAAGTRRLPGYKPAETPERALGPARLIAFNKPFGVICQFSRDGDHPALADFIKVPDVYPAGRLDTDSEGLLLLTNHGPLQHRISSPAAKNAGASGKAALGKAALGKTYWVQVEGEPDDAAISTLSGPLNLGDFVTAPSRVRRIAEPPHLWPRNPPIRHRAAIPTAWLEITISEGKNRQVRRMTAKAGFPTLRLIRAAIGPVQIGALRPGEWRNVDLHEIGYAG
jgi:23S rRNA pseudouridine2457 synthase